MSKPEEGIPLEACALLELNQLPTFVTELESLRATSETCVVKFLSRIAFLSPEERLDDEFINFMVIKHQAIIASIERQLNYWHSFVLNEPEQDLINQCQHILEHMKKAQVIFDACCSLPSKHYH